MRTGKRKAAALCALMLAGFVTGCGSGKAGEGAAGTQEPVKGAYTEIREELPQELSDRKVRQLYTAGEQVRLLTTKQETEGVILQEWALGEDGFAEVTPGWLAETVLPVSGDWSDIKLLNTEDGTQYLFAGYVAEGEEEYKSHLWRGGDAGAREITPEKWTVPNEEWGGYEMLTGIAALDNGTLLAASYTSVDILNGEDGSIRESEQAYSFYDNVVSNGEDVWMWSSQQGGASAVEVEKRREGRSGDVTKLTFSEDTGGTMLSALKDGTLILAGEGGIFRGTESAGAGEDTDWERLIAGVDTDFGLSGSWCTGLAALPDGRIWALFQESEGGAVLNRYEYDPEAIIEIKEELNLYTVYESGILNQAAAMYHRAHPEVLITIQYAYPQYYYGETDYNAVYQELNTMLTGDRAPDILVTDHLNAESYVSKGLLEDISDIVGPMEESGELLSNITGAYLREDGHRYLIPLEFGFHMALGRDITAKDMASMEALAAFLAGKQESYMGPRTAGELTDLFYPFFCNEMVHDKQLDKEVLSEHLKYLKAIGENCGILSVREKDDRAFNMWWLASEAKLAFAETAGFNDAMLPLSIADYIKGDFAAFGNSFIPMVQTGICSKSDHKETAKDFLKFALSEAVQTTDAYGGFPVNEAALKEMAHRDRSEAEAYTSIATEAGDVEFKIAAYSAEEAERLVEICKGLNGPVGEDGKIREVLAEALEGYLNGEQTVEDTVRRVEDGLKMYLAE